MTPETRSLLRASAVGDTDAVKSLIAEGTDINCVSAAGQTPLMLAAGFGHEAIVRALLGSGAFLGAQDELGLTAADWSRNFPRITQLIKEAGAPPTDEINSNGQSKTTFRLPSPKKPAFESNDSRVTLGGLAGAILRERVAKSAPVNELAPQNIHDETPPPAPPLIASADEPSVGVVDEPPVEFVDEPPVAIVDEAAVEQAEEPVRQPEIEPIVETPVIEPVTDENQPVIESRFQEVEEEAEPTLEDLAVEPHSAEEPIVEELFAEESAQSVEPAKEVPESSLQIVHYPSQEEELFESFAEREDDTLSKAKGAATDETSPGGQQPRGAFQSLGLYEPPPARISKVQVGVPPKTPQGSATRTLIWLLVIIFLGGGAYAGYRLSTYFLNSNSPPAQTTVTPKAEPPPNLPPVKAAPLVGGELAGTELFVPDAPYPATATPQSGTVVVRVRVSQRGIVLSSEATEGHESLRGAAVQASKQAAFSPEKLRGLGQVVGGTITYTFVAPTTSTTASEAATASPEVHTNKPQVGGPLAGTEIDVPQPEYPAAAQGRNITGKVTIVVRVSRSGHVVSWRTLDGDNLLRPAALKAAKAATFDPAKLPGTGDVVGTITFTFDRQ